MIPSCVAILYRIGQSARSSVVMTGHVVVVVYSSDSRMADLTTATSPTPVPNVTSHLHYKHPRFVVSKRSNGTMRPHNTTRKLNVYLRTPVLLRVSTILTSSARTAHATTTYNSSNTKLTAQTYSAAQGDTPRPLALELIVTFLSHHGDH